MKQGLFIGHDASRTGAPFVLLHLLQWLRLNVPEFGFELLLLNDGELIDEYRKVCEVHLLRRRRSGSKIWRVLRKIMQEFDIRFGTKRRLLSRLAKKYSVVVGNTVVTLRQLGYFKKQGLAAICWMHELDSVVDHFHTRSEFLNAADSVDRFIVGSKAVHCMLTRRGINRPVDVIYEFVQIVDRTWTANADVKSELGIPPDAFVVGACAAIEPRKGVDLYIETATDLAELAPDIFCIWVGGKFPGTKSYYEEIQVEVDSLGLGDRVRFVEPRYDLLEYYAAMNVFFLPSREDPFPLVCLEAASIGKPVVCFENAGGMPEFVEDDCGFSVPYLDTRAAAEKIFELYNDPELAKQMGIAAARKVRLRHDVDVCAPKIFEVVVSLDQ